ncbi:MAG: hypothetical protein LC132_01975 [Burkholderiales bacterium]|nr:hypothetical protein [Burkholderiales bacterium]
MVKGLANEHERDIYNRYVDLNNAIIGMSMLTEGYLQQAYHGYFKHLLTLMDLHHAQDSQRITEAYPVIMTEKQYQDHYARAQKETRERKASFKDIILELLGQYTTDREDKPKTPKPIKDALEALKKEPVTSEFILSRINKHLRLGYRQLPDGRRSDQMSKEEWQQAFEEMYLAKHKITIDGRPATYEEAMREVGEQRIIRHWRRAYEAEKPIDDFEDMDLEEKEELSGITWHDYEAPPEGLTKWDIIAGDWDMTELYSCAYQEDAGHEKAYFNEFIKDFPKLFSALKEELAKYKGLAKIADTKPANYLKEAITYGELADAGIWYYQDITTPSHWDVVKRAGQPGYRKLNGIAILKEDTYSKSVTHIDENGYFIDPHKDHLLERITAIENKEALIRTRDTLLMEGLRLVLAFNAILDIFAEVYATPELAHLKKDESHLKSILGAFNNITMSLYDATRGSDEEIQAQRKTLKEVYPAIDLEALRPTEETISKVKAKIADKGVTGVFSSGSQENSIHNYILELAGISRGGN